MVGRRTTWEVRVFADKSEFEPWGQKPAGMSWNHWSKRQCCARKVRHATWEAARKAGLLVWLENPQGVNPPTPYPCAVLGDPHYHCGHKAVMPSWRPQRAERVASGESGTSCSVVGPPASPVGS